VEITDTLDHGDTVAVLAQVRTRGGASGVALEGPIAYVLEFEGALVRRVRSYLDQQDALDAVSGPDSGAE
jgi:ketosteroid isomerase-like protein